MKKLIFTVLCSLLYFIGKATTPQLTVVDGCVAYNIISITYGAGAVNDPDIGIWLPGPGGLIGPLSPTSITPNGNGGYTYKYDLSTLLTSISPDSCYHVYAAYGLSSTPAEVEQSGTPYTLCPCGIDLKDGCIHKDTLSMTFGAGVMGNPNLNIWIQIGINNLLGALAPYSIVHNLDGTWTYKYDLLQFGTLLPSDTCLGIWAWWNPNASVDEVKANGVKRSICACPIDILGACIRKIEGNDILTIIYDAGASGDPNLSIWVPTPSGSLLGPLLPSSVTLQNDGTWEYKYNLSLMGFPTPLPADTCLVIYAWWDPTASTSVVKLQGIKHKVCACGIHILGGCNRVIDGNNMLSITYDASAGGNPDLSIWVVTNTGLHGPLSASTITYSGGNWVYEYNLSLLGYPLNPDSCIGIFAYWSVPYPSMQDVVRYGVRYKVCPCDITVKDGCFRQINGVPILTINYTQTLGIDYNVCIWMRLPNGSLLGPLAPFNITQNPNGGWDYQYDLSQIGYLSPIKGCIIIYSWWGPNWVDEQDVKRYGTQRKYCPCRAPEDCDASFNYCVTTDDPATITFTPNTTDPNVSMIYYDFGDGNDCYNCYSHTYSTSADYTICQRTYYFEDTTAYCESCIRLCFNIEGDGQSHKTANSAQQETEVKQLGLQKTANNEMVLKFVLSNQTNATIELTKDGNAIKEITKGKLGAGPQEIKIPSYDIPQGKYQIRIKTDKGTTIANFTK